MKCTFNPILFKSFENFNAFSSRSFICASCVFWTYSDQLFFISWKDVKFLNEFCASTMNDLNVDDELDDEFLLDRLNCSSLFSSNLFFSSSTSLSFVVVLVTAVSSSSLPLMEFFVFPEKFIVIKVDEFAFFLLKLPSFSFILHDYSSTSSSSSFN